MKSLILNLVRSFGYDIVPFASSSSDLSTEHQAILKQVHGLTLTSLERQAALVQAVRYIVQRKIDGCLVECGVWRGGSSMLMALTLLAEGDRHRTIYLYDTFAGMTPPSPHDRNCHGTDAAKALRRDPRKTGAWCYASLRDVQSNLARTDYPSDQIRYVPGPVEQTIPYQAPAEPIALLRLDTDWYGSTKHELIHLFPRVQTGGILIIDDYGHWQGARLAVDEYLATLDTHYLLHRIDYTGRLLIKQ